MLNEITPVLSFYQIMQLGLDASKIELNGGFEIQALKNMGHVQSDQLENFLDYVVLLEIKRRFNCPEIFLAIYNLRDDALFQLILDQIDIR